MTYGLDMIKQHGWFKDHEVTRYTDDLIVWMKPGTSIYSVKYRIDQNSLIVVGDIGEAVYQWSSTLTWAFLNGTDFSYFHSKCRASPKGFPWYDWSEERAKEQLEELFSDASDELDKNNLGECLSSCGTEADWQMFTMEKGYEMLGADWWELNIGKVPALQCVGHWYGLKLATDIVLGKAKCSGS
jgi:hypothetical protein